MTATRTATTTYIRPPVAALPVRSLDCLTPLPIRGSCVKVCPVCGTEYGDEAAFCSRDRSSLRPVAAESSAGLVGQLVGDRYQVERRLGQGGMGEVRSEEHTSEL